MTPDSTPDQQALKVENIAVAMQNNQPRCVGGDESIHEHALAAEQNICQPFDPDERIIDLMRGQKERVLTNV